MSQKCEMEIVDKHQKDCSSVDLSLNSCLATAAKKAAFSLCTSINTPLSLQESRTQMIPGALMQNFTHELLYKVNYYYHVQRTPQ
jgi:hypothetical protein